MKTKISLQCPSLCLSSTLDILYREGSEIGGPNGDEMFNCGHITIVAEKGGIKSHNMKTYNFYFKKVIIPIDDTFKSHCLEKVEMVKSSPVYTCIHLVAPKRQIMNK